MASDRTSFELISHFDGPHQLTPAPGATGSASALPSRHQTRNIRWVLKWSAALGILFFSVSVLFEFAYLAMAAHDFARAARAGAVEATLPRATHESVQQAVNRRLAAYPQLDSYLQMSMLQNGAPALKILPWNDGDRITVIVSVDSSAVLPAWIRALRFWRSDEKIEVAAERQLPGRQLASGGRL
jgi:hypothetical protein